MAAKTKQISIGASNDQFQMYAQTGNGGNKIKSVRLEYKLDNDVAVNITSALDHKNNVTTSMEVIAHKAKAPGDTYDYSIPARDSKPDKAAQKAVKKLEANGVADGDIEKIMSSMSTVADICENKSDKIFGAGHLNSIAELKPLKNLANENAQHFAKGQGLG